MIGITDPERAITAAAQDIPKNHYTATALHHPTAAPLALILPTCVEVL